MVLSRSNNERRKLDHIDIVLEKDDVEGPIPTLFNCVFIPHQAAPEIDLEDVTLRSRFLGKDLDAPLMITGMTGGAPGTEKINRALAQVAEEFRIAIGVGSQRAAVENSSLRYTFTVVREAAKDVPVIANIGAAEVLKYGVKIIEKVVEMINADAVAIHLNLAQEAVQPEGTPKFKGVISAVADVARSVGVPVIIKEVGNGLSYEVVKKFYEVGIRYFDVGGAGGTNWVTVEKYRALKQGDNIKKLVAEHLVEWGIPTAASIIEARSVSNELVIIGSGGIRTALDALKALRLGADLVGMARPLLLAYKSGVLKEYLASFIRALSVAFMLSGAKSIAELRTKPVVITGVLSEWVRARKLRVP